MSFMYVYMYYSFRILGQSPELVDLSTTYFVCYITTQQYTTYISYFYMIVLLMSSNAPDYTCTCCVDQRIMRVSIVCI